MKEIENIQLNLIFGVLELQRGNLTHCQKEPMKKLMILRVLYSQFNRGKRLEKGEIIEY